MEKLPLETQTLYAELLDRLRMLEAERTIGSLPGTFVGKTIKGREYVYFQYVEPGDRRRQYYIGPKDEATERLIERFRHERREQDEDERAIHRLAAQLRAGGALVTDASTARVLRGLSDAGVFRLGGVLIGTHAFTAIGNALGVNWLGTGTKTLDIDLAASRTLDVATPESADVPGVLESLEMGFLPVPRLNPVDPSTSFKVRGQALRVDLLTPATKPGKPVTIHRFAAAAQPLRYLDYLMEHPIAAAVINGGATLVNVPDPARFALHKLLVSTERPAAEHTKRDKDIAQAAQVLAVLVDERPGDLVLAHEGLIGRGSGWEKRLDRGLRSLEKQDESLSAALKRTLGD